MKKNLMLQWHITERCNNACKHCYMYDKKTHLSVKSADMPFYLCKTVVSQFAALCSKLSDLTNIHFKPKYILSGGDPMLHPEVFQILNEVRQYSDQVSLLGNPDTLDVTTVNRLRDLGVKSYQISLDGTEKLHDYIRGRGQFQKALKGLHNLKEAGISSHVMFTLYKGNMDDLLPLIKIMAAEKVVSFAFSRVTSFGNAKQLDSRITPLEYRDLLGQVYSLQQSLKTEGYQTRFPLKDHLWKLFLHEKGFYSVDIQNRDQKTVDGCHMGQSFLVLLPDGNALACRRFYSPVGKFPQQDLSGIFLSAKKMAAYRKIKHLETCKSCELLYHCRGCRAVAHGFHGDWRKADPQCWRFLC